MERAETILIVDDEERNLRLMKAVLMPLGCRVICADSGEEALAQVTEWRPDLILLDVMMPGMDGFEVCRRIKEDADLAQILVVMVTALSQKSDRIHAMNVGVDDFLSKPVDHAELLIRVKSMLRIKSYQDKLLGSYQEIAEQNKKLKKLEKVKEDLMHMIVHDLSSPLTNIAWGLDLLMMGQEELPEKQVKLLEELIVSSGDLNAMVANILDVYKCDNDRLVPLKEASDPLALIQEVVPLFKPKLEEKELTFSFSHPEVVPSLPLDPMLIKRVIVNLLNNAIRHTPRGGEVCLCIRTEPEEDNIRVTVADQGQGLAPEFHVKIFEKFEQLEIQRTSGRQAGYGMGLSFCKIAVEAHKGKIWVESEGAEKGCTFCFTLPLAEITEEETVRG